MWLCVDTVLFKCIFSIIKTLFFPIKIQYLKVLATQQLILSEAKDRILHYRTFSCNGAWSSFIFLDLHILTVPFNSDLRFLIGFKFREGLYRTVVFLCMCEVNIVVELFVNSIISLERCQ